MWVDAPQVGNFSDQKWGISVIAVSRSHWPLTAGLVAWVADVTRSG